MKLHKIPKVIIKKRLFMPMKHKKVNNLKWKYTCNLYNNDACVWDVGEGLSLIIGTKNEHLNIYFNVQNRSRITKNVFSLRRNSTSFWLLMISNTE